MHERARYLEPTAYDLAQLWRQVRLGIIEQRSNVILQCSLAAALIIQKEWLAIPQHDVT